MKKKTGFVLDLDLGKQAHTLTIILVDEEVPSMAFQKKLPPRKGKVLQL